MSSTVRFADVPPGYPKLASLISKDKNYAVFRKFSALNARNILYLQSELTDLESQLEKIDQDLRLTDEGCLRSREDFCSDPDRSILVRKIRRTLHLYNSAVSSYDAVLSLHSPTSQHVNALKCWVKSAQPISDSSQPYLDSKEVCGNRRRSKDVSGDMCLDLASLTKPADSWLARVLRRSILGQILMKDWINYSNDEEKQTLYFYPGSTIDGIVSGIAVVCAVVLTVAAILVLHFEQREAVRIGLVGVFTLLLASIMALCGAKKAEVMMGTVGYAAVLVVFISGQGVGV